MSAVKYVQMRNERYGHHYVHKSYVKYQMWLVGNLYVKNTGSWDCSQLTSVSCFWNWYSDNGLLLSGQWASYHIRKIAGCACAGNVFPRRRFQRETLVSDPGMHHGTCVTHVPWCMSGSLTCGDGENVPGIPGACAPTILRIWQEAQLCESGLIYY